MTEITGCELVAKDNFEKASLSGRVECGSCVLIRILIRMGSTYFFVRLQHTSRPPCEDKLTKSKRGYLSRLNAAEY
jgi:hypothetical protein